MFSPRTTTYPIHVLFHQRWSPRAFDQSALSDDDVLEIIEAARWAPSAYNVQPWRFIYALRGDKNWSTFLSLLDPFNADWAKNAGALIFLVSDQQMTTPQGETVLSDYNSFDAGAAWVQLALQATASGYHAHAMAGIHKEETAKALNIPDNFKIEVAIAVGKRTDPSTLSEDMQAREQPSPRKPLSEISFKGGFGA